MRYRVMIVDDEKYIRLSIRTRIDWRKYDMEVIAEAGNGEEAYAAVQLYQPDIMLVDIRMPIIDGLGLIRLLSENSSHIKIIILSAYQDFVYAKKGMQMGVKDYLLKPVDEQELDEVLQRIKRELDQEEKKEQIPVIDSIRWQQAQADRKCYACISAYVHNGEDDIRKKLVAGELYEMIRKNSYKSIRDLSLYLFSDSPADLIVSFLLQADEITEPELDFLVIGMCREIKEAQDDICISMSEVFCKAAEIPVHLSKTIQMLKYKLYFRKLRFDRNVIVNSESRAFRQGREILSVLHGLAGREDYYNIEELSGQLLKLCMSRLQSIKELEFILDDLFALLYIIAGRAGNYYDVKILFQPFRISDYILRYDSCEELQQDIERVINTVLSYGKSKREREVTLVIREYIQEHFMDNLTTSTIAKMFHLNSNYLSTLFKEKSGVTLTSYIEGIRMEKARELLKNKTFSVADVAATVGYADTNYFGKVFKKYYGISPGQHRNLQTE